LGVWIAAILIAWLYHRQVAELLVPYLSQPSVRLAVAFIALIVATLVDRRHLGRDPLGLDRQDRSERH
jgi:uncharacterized membrane protein required for colicin V production